jgi:proline iminopeptidase
VLDVGDGHRIHWETWGRQDGVPAVVLHGGPGSGCAPWQRELLDPDVFRVVAFDQRGCGRSTPHAGVDAAGALRANTTAHLIADMEALRTLLGFSRWLVVGGSWGSTLALAYAQAHPEAVSGLVLFSVATTPRHEVAWLTRDMGRLLPEAWERFSALVPEAERDGDLAAAYHRLVMSSDAGVRDRAAVEWCRWEDALVGAREPSPRFADPVFRLGFVRLVTWYWSHAAWLEDGALLAGAAHLAGIPGTLVHGRLDLGSPLDVPFALSRAWPGSELVVIEDAGHGGSPAAFAAIRAAAARIASA